MELWQALALTEYRYAHPSADTLVAAYLGYQPTHAPIDRPALSEKELAEWKATGVAASPYAVRLSDLPPILKQKFPFLSQAQSTIP